MTELVTILPSVLIWARETTRFTKSIVLEHFDQPSKKPLGLTEAVLNELERAPTPIRVSLLKELGKLYKQPLAVFFLHTPPALEKGPTDFRTMRGRQQALISPLTMMALRSARKIQAISQELMEELDETKGFQPRRYTTTADPATLGATFREQIQLSLERQSRFREADAFFVWLRARIEETGVLVLKEPFPVDDALAFSLTEAEPFVITVNSKWGGRSYAPKIFSLLHEYAHLLLRTGGICNNFTYSAAGIEAFCNKFAASVLIPDQAFREELAKVASPFDINAVDAYLSKLSEIFKASKPALLLRFVEHKLVPQDYFDAKIAEWSVPYDEAGAHEIPFRVLPHTKAINSKGKSFSTLVLRALGQDKITRDAAAEFLDVQPTQISKVAQKLGDVA